MLRSGARSGKLRSGARSAVMASLIALVFAATPAEMKASRSTRTTLPTVATVLSEDASGVLVRFDAPRPEWRSIQQGRYLYPVIAGFGTLQETGKPALPVRIERIGIPFGAVPTLTIVTSAFEDGPDGKVGPVQSWVPLEPGDTTQVPVTMEDPQVYATDGDFPSEEPVRLGTIGALREQPFVELLFNPVVANPYRGASRAYRSVTVRVAFGASALVSRSSEPAVEEPEYEGLYDAAILNAGQAKAFRGVPPQMTPEVSVDLGSVQENLAGIPGGRYKFGPVSGKYKLIVNRDGVYRLSPTWASTNASGLLSFNPATYRVDCQGQQIPITVVDANTDGTFNGADYIEFYGQGLTWNILEQDEWDGGDYTDDNVYWIYADNGAVTRAPTRLSAPGSGYAIPLDFSETLHHEVGNRFQPLIPVDGVDHWYQDPPVVANPSPSSQVYTIQTPGVSSATATASIKVRLLGDTYLNNYHRSRILVNGTQVAGPTDWDGWREFTHGVDDGPATFAQSILSDGSPATTSVTVALPLGRTVGGNGITRDIVFQNWIEITYGRQFRVDTDANGDGTEDQALVFAVANQNTQVHLTGLTQPTVAIYEITTTLGGTPLANPVRVTGAAVTGVSAPYSVDFQFAADGTLPVGTKRRFIVATVTTSIATGDLVPASVRADVASNLHTPGTGADWLVIANGTFLDASPGSAWQQLLARRASQGLRVRVVDVEDVYDEFSWGIAEPQAMRDFVAYVYSSWPRIDPLVPLKYVVLLGDGSIDYKNGYGNPSNQNLLSSYIRSVSGSAILGYMTDETYFTAISGADALPDVYAGRWPVHSAAETNAIAQKILNYETQASGQSWQSDVVFVADDADIGFEQVQDQQINDWILGTPYTYHRTYERQIGLANPGWTGSQVSAETRDRVQRQLNGQTEPGRDIGPGAALLSYVGHGSWQNWGDNFSFFVTASSGVDDLTPVTNGTKLPLVLVADCLSAGFTATSSPSSSTDLTYAMCDDFLVTANKGAIGYIAPTHLTFSNTHSLVEGAFFEEVLGPKKIRGFGALNAGIQAALASTGDVFTLRSYTLLGDPAVSLVMPAPKPPTNLLATPGNHQVTLSWTQSPEAATYRVYRAANSPNGTYQMVASGVTGSGTTVTGLQNCVPYYFSVVAVNAQGFEGPRFPLNTGCGSGGACLTATPVAPAAPPPPGGLTATDGENGGTVILQWAASPSTDDVLEYRVSWGLAANALTQSLSAGLATSLPVGGLQNGVTYYFAVSAVNCSVGEGTKSAAVPAIPHRIDGIKPPNAIEDLRVFRSPDAGDHIDDARLQWSVPGTNIYGQSSGVAIASQEIYSGTTPLFAIDPAHKLATVSGSTTQYIHENGFGDSQRHFYLIVAIDAAGNRSGVSHDLPKGVDQLHLTRSGGTLTLSWPAVTQDVDGHTTQIASYTLYGRTTLFRRADIAPALLIASGLSGPSTTVPTPAGSFFCYSLITIDNRGALSPW